MTKTALRKLYKEKRAAISSKERLRLDDLLLLQFQQLNFEGIQTVLTYWPMAAQAEPNTHLFSGYLRHMIYGLQIAYPVCDFTNNTMQAVLINEDTIYTTAANGMTEPKEGVTIEPTAVDLILVPLLAYDVLGYRVGYGKGFYDRYLSLCRQDAVAIGFSYFDPEEQISDTNDFDIPLNYCITPNSIYEFE